MEQSLQQYLKQRAGDLERIRRPWEDFRKEIYKVFIPERLVFSKDLPNGAGKRLMTDIYNGAGVFAAQTLADGYLGYVTPMYQPWFQILIFDPKLSKSWAVKRYLHELELAMYDEYRRSNFYGEIGTYYLDGGTTGTAFIDVVNDPTSDRLRFNVRHPDECWIDEGEGGEVDTIMRRFPFTARQAVEAWGYDNLPKPIQEAARNDSGRRFFFRHFVFPRKDRDPRKITAENMRFASYYTTDSFELIEEGGFNSLPTIPWRYSRLSGEIYGRSPATRALPDMLGLNVMDRDMMLAGQYAARPAWNIPVEMMGNVQLVPDGHNYYEDSGRRIEPIMSGSNYNIGLDQMQRKEEMINRHFKVDFFHMLSKINREMTATEVVERIGEKAAVLAPEVGRFTSEAMNRIHLRALTLAAEAGRLPEMPAEMRDQEKIILKFDYCGPLPEAQKRLFKTQNLTRMLEVLAMTAQFDQGAVDNADFDAIIHDAFDAYHGSHLLKDPKVVAELRRIRQEQLAQMQALQQAETFGRTTSSLAKRMEPGSIGEALLKGEMR